MVAVGAVENALFLNHEARRERRDNLGRKQWDFQVFWALLLLSDWSFPNGTEKFWPSVDNRPFRRRSVASHFLRGTSAASDAEDRATNVDAAEARRFVPCEEGLPYFYATVSGRGLKAFGCGHIHIFRSKWKVYIKWTFMEMTSQVIIIIAQNRW